MGKWIARKKTPPEYGESLCCACQHHESVAGGAQRGLARKDRRETRRCTYRAHDCGLPVELCARQSSCCLGSCAACWAALEREGGFAASAVGSGGVTYQIISDGTGRAGRGRITTVKVSSEHLKQHRRAAAEVQRVCRRPALRAVMRANRAGSVAAREGSTYRPKSVSSLLMRLRAMVCGCGCV